MSQTKSCRGVSRVLAKLEESVQCGKYYEAHQKYRTLYFRYLSQKRFDECLDLLFSGAQTLLDNQQYSSGADLGLLVVDTLEKTNVTDIELWINRLGTIIAKIRPNLVERETLLVSAWSSTETSKQITYSFFSFLLFLPQNESMCTSNRSKQSNGAAMYRKIKWDIR